VLRAFFGGKLAQIRLCILGGLGWFGSDENQFIESALANDGRFLSFFKNISIGPVLFDYTFLIKNMNMDGNVVISHVKSLSQHFGLNNTP